MSSKVMAQRPKAGPKKAVSKDAAKKDALEAQPPATSEPSKAKIAKSVKKQPAPRASAKLPIKMNKTAVEGQSIYSMSVQHSY